MPRVSIPVFVAFLDQGWFGALVDARVSVFVALCLDWNNRHFRRSVSANVHVNILWYSLRWFSFERLLLHDCSFTFCTARINTVKNLCTLWLCHRTTFSQHNIMFVFGVYICTLTWQKLDRQVTVDGWFARFQGAEWVFPSYRQLGFAWSKWIQNRIQNWNSNTKSFLCVPKLRCHNFWWHRVQPSFHSGCAERVVVPFQYVYFWLFAYISKRCVYATHLHMWHTTCCGLLVLHGQTHSVIRKGNLSTITYFVLDYIYTLNQRFNFGSYICFWSHLATNNYCYVDV